MINDLIDGFSGTEIHIYREQASSINSWVVALELLMFFLLQKFIHGGWPKILTSCDSSLRKCTIKSHFNLDTPRTTCIKMHYIYLLILWILITLCLMSWKKETNFKVDSKLIRKLIQSWFKVDLKLMQSWCKVYSKLIQCWCKVDAKLMQSWFKVDS